MEKRKHYEGLNDQQVVESRAKYGVNLLTPPKKDSLWKQFLEKFSDPLIVILIIAGILSIGIACDARNNKSINTFYLYEI